MAGYSLPDNYGSTEWLEKIISSYTDDPWGHNFKGTEVYRHQQIINLIRENIELCPTKTRILDIGCALGHFTRYLYGSCRDLVAIDVSKTAIERAKNEFAYIDFRVGSVESTGLRRGSFDLVTCLEVLYYMDAERQRELLRAIKTLLRGGGKAVFTSVIGEPPYFESRDLVSLLSKHFKILSVQYYGARGYWRWDAALFNLFKHVAMVEKYLCDGCGGLKQKALSAGRSKHHMALTMIAYVGERDLLKLVALQALRGLKQGIKVYLRWKLPAAAFHRIGRRLSLRPTHTFVVVEEEDSRMALWSFEEKQGGLKGSDCV